MKTQVKIDIQSGKTEIHDGIKTEIQNGKTGILKGNKSDIQNVIKLIYRG